MPFELIVLFGTHILSTLFWLFSSFILARAWSEGIQRMFRWQMLAATLAVLSGARLWVLFHWGLFGPQEMILAGGALCAIVAAGAQGVLVGGGLRRLKAGELPLELALRRMTQGQRLAAGLLALTLLAMVGAPHAGHPFPMSGILFFGERPSSP